LEPEFWAALEAEAAERGVSLPAVVAALDAERAATAPERPLASVCRVHALLWAMKSGDHGVPTKRSFS
jgi:predicted DNA-binding ribbon-helix-helix protein